jgi:hypothetical protein
MEGQATDRLKCESERFDTEIIKEAVRVTVTMTLVADPWSFPFANAP